METMASSTASVTSSSVTTTSISKQPTYTTAGTLYNPQSSQPLQAPTRRGRSFKWANGTGHSDLALLPKSLLSSLPLRSGGRMPVVHQYSPLQQNYDRAVSPNPFRGQGHQLATMPQEGLRMPSNQMIDSIPGVDGPTESKDGQTAVGAQAEESDSDGDYDMDPLMSMTVKSLHNLASYPNPSQKKAQKALLRGTKPFNGNGGSSRPSRGPTPSNLSHNGSIASSPRDNVIDRNPIKAPQPQPLVHRQAPVKLGGRLGTFNRFTTGLRPPPGLVVPNRGPNGTYGSSSTLAVGPGAPRPLTAGPPGQRQYRPSTFESTFRALQNNEEERQEKANAYMNEALETNRLPLFGDAPAALHASEPSIPQNEAFMLGGRTVVPSREDTPSRNSLLDDSEEDFYPPGVEKALKAYKASLPALGPVPSWRTKASEWAHGLEPGSNQWIAEATVPWRENIDLIWYSGLENGVYFKPTRQARKKFEYQYGAIGEGRPGVNEIESRWTGSQDE